MTDIFISYAREDLDAARRLAAALEGQGWSIFWDRTIPAGKSWRVVIGAALTDARCVLVLWSQHSVTSDFVLEEADRGLRRRVLIPAFIDSVEPPLGFGSIHAADLSTWDGTHEDALFKQFLGDISGVLGPAPVVPAAERPKAKAEAQHKAREQQRQQAEAETKRKRLEQTPGTVFRDIEAPWCPEMVVIPAGSFVMGSPEAEEGRSSNEGPQHTVKFEQPFALGRYPVTFDEYDHFCTETKRKKPEGWSAYFGYGTRDLGFNRGRRPAVNVSWQDARAYCAWLSEQTGQGYRLPSEAAWEYACRAGTTTPFWTGETISTEQANYCGDYTYGLGRKGEYRGRATPVDTFEPNPWGLHDMHGNVAEWCEDCWHGSYKGAQTDGSAWLQGRRSVRVIRGGSWTYPPGNLRSAWRGRGEPGAGSVFLGLRVSRTLTS
jgi:formylglycine-generating enzyme required for sulfatase activity